MTKFHSIISLLFQVLLISKFCSATAVDATAAVITTTPTKPPSSSSSNTLKLTERNFQIDFLNEVRNNAEHMALLNMNELLQQLKLNTKNPAYADALESATQTNDLSAKVLFTKQFLDVEDLLGDDAAAVELELIALRNVNFLEKLNKQLYDIQDASVQDLRQFRMFELCRQFREKSGGVPAVTFRPPYATKQTKLVPIDEHNVEAALRHLMNGTNAAERANIIELDRFGRTLYARVNIAGAEIIDDYLISLRKLLKEVIVDKHAHEKDSSKLTKLLDEIDIILQTKDFYEKRQKLYAYLEENLAADYEKFKASEHAQEDLADVLTKLRERGLDLFVTFLFSNFEFLERLHKELAHMLPNLVDNNAADVTTHLDEVTRLLYAVHTSYNDFKRDSENNEKYEAYLEPVKELYSLTRNLGDDAHIFELLHNASLNVGSVTLNMIRARCDEI